jgi:hypothetical protein
MTNESTPTRADWAEWARAHKACFEILPLIEMHKGEKVQVGFELSLFAQIPPEVSLAEASQRSLEIGERLREMLESLVGPEHPTARLDIGPVSPAETLRPEAGYAPEVELSAQIVRRHETFEPVPQDSRELLAFLEAGLNALGLHQGSAGGPSR